MKRSLIILLLFSVPWSVHAKGLSPSLQQFAEVCLRQRAAIRVEQPDHDQQFEQLYGCLKTYTTLPLAEGVKILHPGHTYSEEDFAGHIVFSPEYVVKYLTEQVSDPYTESVQYVTTPDSHRATDEAKVIYHNSLLPGDGEESFWYRVSQGEQQLIVIAEDNSVLDVTIETNGEAVTFSTAAEIGLAQRVWQEDKPYAAVKVRVANRSQQTVTFVIAAY